MPGTSVSTISVSDRFRKTASRLKQAGAATGGAGPHRGPCRRISRTAGCRPLGRCRASPAPGHAAMISSVLDGPVRTRGDLGAGETRRTGQEGFACSGPARPAGAWRAPASVTVRDARETVCVHHLLTTLGHMVMKLAATAAAVLAAALALSACDLAATLMQTAVSPAAPPPTCHQQYDACKHGVVGGEFAVFGSAFRAAAWAAHHQDAPKLAAALNRPGAAARWLSATPPPRCANPQSYYGQMLATATAAADSAKAATRPSVLILAAGQLTTVSGSRTS
jgi:hypothetical protein